MKDNKGQFLLMKSYRDTFDDMPDGAFFAMAEEQYWWDAGDWKWFSEQLEKEKADKKIAKKK